MVASSDYLVNIIISTKDKGSAGVKKAVGSWTELKSALSLAKGMFDQVYQAAQKVYEMVKLGAQIEAIEHRFIAFAGGAEQASKYLEAFNIGAQNTVDEMTAMEKSARLLQMGLATNADEMQQMAAMATKLGNQTISAGARVDDFSLLLANQAVRRLDNFGMSSGRVRDRIDELIESGQALNREQAFKMAVMEEGSTALAKLGDTSEMAAVKMDQTESSWKNITSNIAEMAAVWAEWTGTIDRWKDGLGAVEGFFNLWAKGAKHILTGGKDAGQVLQAYNGYIADGVSTMHKYGVAAQITWQEQFELNLQMEAADTTSRSATVGFVEFAQAINKVDTETLKNVEALKKQNAEMLALKEFTLDAGMQWKSYYDGVDQQAEDFETRREKLTTQHQETLDELAKRGQSQAIQINEAAEKQKLADLVWSLEQAELQLSEYGDKTRESTLRAKQKQIEDLRGQVGTQQTLLDNYHAGRLRTTGENVNALIGEEDRRHQAALTGLEEEIAKTKELQRQQLGNLLLQTFDSWAEIAKVPKDKMFEMRNAIAVEYGLISAEEAQLLALSVGSWDAWQGNMYDSTEETAAQLGKDIEQVRLLQQSLDGLPAMKVIEIMIKQVGHQAYPEMTPIPSTPAGSYVPPASTTINNFNQNVNTQATSHNVMNDFRAAQAMVE